MTQSSELFSNDKKRLPLIEDDIDAEVARFEAAERARLGLEQREHWVEDMANLGFTKSEKSRITILLGGLTMLQDHLVGGALKHLGYTTLALNVPDNDALRVGKEFGNRGQCNPTYFTVGNLVQFLIHLRDDKGMSSKEIVDKFVFLTAGACGPCRFGMYVTEYRKALRDAGFDGFRVMLFQQQGGLSQATGEESGLELNPKFFISLLKAIVAGDVMNAVGYRLRPFEVEPGATDRALSQAKDICYDALANGKSILAALWRGQQILKTVAVDRTLPKPRVSIIGEFWAMTTEGDGNYQLQRFLESEGAECDIQLVTAWILYNIWEVRFDTKNRATLREEDAGRFGLKGAGEFGVLTREVGLWVADKALRTVFQTFAHAAGLYDYHLPDMNKVADVAAPYYDNDLRGGEGHMEVGKLILNVVNQKATMTLSVKPFGCMPSSGVSDGVQSLITERYPGTIFCAVETSGDGAVNFYSRVQMYLFKARQAAEAELEKTLAANGMTRDDFRKYLNRNPRVGSALYRAPHTAACTSADLANEVAHRRATPAPVRVLRSLGRTASSTSKALLGAVKSAPMALSVAHRASKELAEIARDKGPNAANSAAQSIKNRVLGMMFQVQEETAKGFVAAAGG